MTILNKIYKVIKHLSTVDSTVKILHRFVGINSNAVPLRSKWYPTLFPPQHDWDSISAFQRSLVAQLV